MINWILKKLGLKKEKPLVSNSTLKREAIYRNAQVPTPTKRIRQQRADANSNNYYHDVGNGGTCGGDHFSSGSNDTNTCSGGGGFSGGCD